MSRYDLITEVDGYRDLVQPQVNEEITSTSDDVNLYIRNSSGTYDFNATSQQFTFVGAGNGDYTRYQRQHYQYRVKDSVEYESYFDTVNLIFNTKDTKDASIKMNMHSSPSMNDVNVKFASDSNYVFNDSSITYHQGQLDQTASFTNGEDMRYMGAKQTVSNNVPVNQKKSSSVKYRIAITGESEDDNNIISLTTLTSGLIFDGGFNG